MPGERKKGKQIVATWLSTEELKKFENMMAETHLNKSDLLKAGLEELARKIRNNHKKENSKDENDNDR